MEFLSKDCVHAGFPHWAVLANGSQVLPTNICLGASYMITAGVSYLPYYLPMKVVTPARALPTRTGASKFIFGHSPLRSKDQPMPVCERS